MKKRRKHIDDGLTIDQRRALLQVKIRADVEKHGCFVMCIFGTESTPQWAYSIGIPTTFPGAAELVIFGLQYENMAGIIHSIVALMKEGQTFEAGKQYDGILREHPVYLGRVEERAYDPFFGQAQLYHQSDTGFPVLQIVWPDTAGKFPWQEGFEGRFKKSQPLLFEPPRDGLFI